MKLPSDNVIIKRIKSSSEVTDLAIWLLMMQFGTRVCFTKSGAVCGIAHATRIHTSPVCLNCFRKYMLDMTGFDIDKLDKMLPNETEDDTKRHPANADSGSNTGNP